LGEQALYDALWQNGRPHTKDTRRITIGYRQMSDLARLTVNNCKANILSLIQKLSVEEIDGFSYTQGRTYLVYDYSSIMERRRDAGLTHYVKSKGVVFVNPATGEPITARRRTTGTPGKGIPVMERGVPETGTQTVPLSDTKGIPLSGGPPNSQVFRNSFRNNDDVGAVEQLLAATEFRTFDRQAIATICKRSREVVPDITPEEISHVFLERARPLVQNRRIENLNGLVLSMWKNWLTPARIAELRDRKQQGRELTDQDREADMARFREEQRARLSDPNLSEEEKQIIRKWI
jgi:hypothetical protein